MRVRPVALILSQTAVRWSGREVGVELIRLVLHVGLRRGEARAVDCCIAIVDGRAQRISKARKTSRRNFICPICFVEIYHHKSDPCPKVSPTSEHSTVEVNN
jgi:hypothetical protein